MHKNGNLTYNNPKKYNFTDKFICKLTKRILLFTNRSWYYILNYKLLLIITLNKFLFFFNIK